MMGQLNKEVLDYDKIFKFMQKQKEGQLSEIEKQEMQKEDEIIKQKMKQAEQTKTYIKFFNPYTDKLIQNTPPDVLSELGIRAYTGSRDVPKDDEKASGLLQMALQRAIDNNDTKQIDMAEYYLAIVMKNVILSARAKNNGQLNPADMPELIKIDTIIEDKARKGIGEALFSYGKELYQYIRRVDQNVSKQHLEQA